METTDNAGTSTVETTDATHTSEPTQTVPTPPVEPVVTQEAPAPAPALEDTAKVAPPSPPISPAIPATDDVVTSTVVSATDDENVASLKVQLAAFAKAVSRPGKKPEDFRQAAKLNLQFTKYVIQYPKVPILDALLAFFKENIETTCAPTNYMKGSTLLGKDDEAQVGYLYGLFYDLATEQVVRINGGQVIQVLKKPEIVGYYNRKIAVIKQNAE